MKVRDEYVYKAVYWVQIAISDMPAVSNPSIFFSASAFAYALSPGSSVGGVCML